MREYIDKNLNEIKKHLKKRKKVISKLNHLSILEEFKEWNEDEKRQRDLIWTLPDLTSAELLNNFCRSIKKEIK